MSGLEKIKAAWCNANAYYEDARKNKDLPDELMNCLFFELDTIKKIIDHLELRQRR